MKYRTLLVAFAALVGSACAAPQDRSLLRERYEKFEADVPMRDGVTLHVVIYAPKDRSTTYPLRGVSLQDPAGTVPLSAWGARPGAESRLIGWPGSTRAPSRDLELFHISETHV